MTAWFTISLAMGAILSQARLVLSQFDERVRRVPGQRKVGSPLKSFNENLRQADSVRYLIDPEPN